MPNPYAQAALTYVRRFRSLGRLWALICIAILWLFMTVIFILHPVDVALFYLFFAGVLQTTALVFHIKDQFLGARAHLMPNYRRVHAAVAVAAVLIFTVLLPLLLSLLAGLRSVGFTVFFAVMFSIFLWARLGKGWTALGIPLIVIAFYGFFTETGSIYFKGFLSGQYEPLAFTIFFFSLATALGGLFRLFCLTEDDPEYQKLQATGLKTAISNQNLTAAPFFKKGWQDRLTDRHIARLANHARRASISGWSRICRWQMGISGVLIFLVCFILFIMLITFSQMLHGKQPHLFAIAMFAGICPLFTLSTIQQSHCLSSEVLLPVDRVSFIRQMGISTAISYFIAWAVSWSIFLLFLLFTQIQIFQFSIRLDILINLSLISALTNVLFFGVAVWVARYRSKVLQFGVIMISFYLQTILMGAAEHHSGELGPAMVLVAGILAVIGLLITYDAYRRWLVTDFD